MIEWSNIWDNLVSAAIGAGGVGSILWWRLDKRKKTADVKQDEVEVVRKIIDEIMQPTIERQKQELAEMNAKYDTLQEKYDVLQDKYDTLQDKYDAMNNKVKECAAARDDCHKMLASLKEDISRLQRTRDNRGRYAKEPRRPKTEKDATTC